MSSISALFANLRAAGIRLWQENGTLRFKAPKGAMTAQIKQQLKAQKAEILAFLAEADKAPVRQLPPLPQVDRNQPLPLSFAQQRLWFLDQLEQGAAAYNTPATLRLDGPLDVAALETALAHIIVRHEALRTVFPAREGQPIQRILSADTVQAPFEIIDLRDADPGLVTSLAKQDLVTPFDLTQAPLLRVRLLRIQTEAQVLLACVHHIVSDGWSVENLIKELAVGYGHATANMAIPVSPPSVQYADYAVWQRQWLAGEEQRKQKQFWLDQLAGAPPLLSLPLDMPRPAVADHTGDRVHVDWTAQQTQAIRRAAQQAGVTLFVWLHSVFAVFLARLSGQDDISIGTPVGNRPRPELEELIGLFVNTVVLRTRVTRHESFVALLRQIHRDDLAAFANSDLPFDQVVEALQPERTFSHTPLFQVLFNLNNATQTELKLSGVNTRVLDNLGTYAKFDITLEVLDNGEAITLGWGYKTSLFRKDTMQNFAKWFTRACNALSGGASHLQWHTLFDEKEKRLLLDTWSQGQAERAPIGKGTFVDRLAAVAQRQPHQPAFLFAAEDPGKELAPLTYGAWYAEGLAIATTLNAAGFGPESKVGIWADRSADSMIGMLGVLASGAAFVMLDPNLPASRLIQMAERAQLDLILAGNDAALPAFDAPCWQPGCQPPFKRHLKIALGKSTPDNLAYLMFTSGSLGEPKAVAISHASMIHYLDNILPAFPLKAQAQLLFIQAMTVDASLTFLLGATSLGATLHVLPRLASLDSDYLVAYLKRQHIDGIKSAPSHLAALDGDGRLASIPLWITGGEAADWTLVNTWQAAQHRVINQYGPTETTVGVTLYVCNVADRHARYLATPLGRPTGRTRVFIVDDTLQPVPPGLPGELLIGGPQLARGYYCQPRLTAQSFVPNPFAQSMDPVDSRLYRTGDRVRFDDVGRLLFIGRRDDQVKVRGFRVEPGEVQAVLAKMPSIQEISVQAMALDQTGTQLVAYVVGKNLSIARLQAYATQNLPGYMAPSAWVVMAKLPRTPHGKVDRQALPKATIHHDPDQTVSPRNPVEADVMAIMSELLPGAKPHVFTDFFQAGGHSLLATQLMARINQHFGLQLAVRTVFEASQPATLAARITAAQNSGAVALPPITPLARTQRPPLSFAQQRLWFLDRFIARKHTYNMPMALAWQGVVDLNGITDALTSLWARHNVLRTRFSEQDGRPVLMEAPAATFPLPVIDLSGLSSDSAISHSQRLLTAEVQRDFDLAETAPIRGFVLRLSSQEHRLALTMHHIVSDGWSLDVMIRELTAHYQAVLSGQPSEKRESLSLQYGDYAAWQRSILQGETQRVLTAFWQRHLSAAPTVHSLPLDRSRPTLESYRGAEIDFTLPANLERLARRHELTLFMLLYSALTMFLARYSDETDICIGSPIANRRFPALESLIGLFVNTLVLRTQLTPETTVADLLLKARQTALDAYAHGDLPFEQIVEAVDPPRGLNHSPLFQIMLVLNDEPLEELDLPGSTITPLRGENPTAMFDLTWTVNRRSEGLQGSLQYNSDIFFAETAQRMVAHFQNLVRHLVGVLTAEEQHRTTWTELSLMNQAERRFLMEQWCEPSAPPFKAVHQRFYDQAQRMPDATAIHATAGYEAPIGNREMTLTFAALAARGMARAKAFRAAGIRQGDLVGVFMPRGHLLLESLLGLLHVGAVYVPLDPDYPTERLIYMLDDAGVEQVLVTAATQKQCPAENLAFILVDTRNETTCHDSCHTPPAAVIQAADPMYVIYTSGSTGKPKGAVLSHGSLANHASCIVDVFQLTPTDRALQFYPFSFDAFGEEVYPTWAAGGAVVIAEASKTPSFQALDAYNHRTYTTVLSYPTAMWHEWVAYRYRNQLATGPAVRLMLLGGERALPDVLQRWRKLPGKPVRLLNTYGPTETTISASWYDPGEAAVHGAAIPIGQPLVGLQFYITDRQLCLQPTGVPGELCIAGPGLGHGYLGRPAVTASVFVPNPFAKQSGDRIYRTGDLVRYREATVVDFLGRLDSQVKLRGFRVELGEIEAVLQTHPQVQDAAAILVERRNGDNDEVPITTLLAALKNLPPSAANRLLNAIENNMPLPQHHASDAAGPSPHKRSPQRA